MADSTYPTEPLRLAFDAESAFDDLGLGDLYEYDHEMLGLREDAIDEELFDAFATPDERVRLEEFRAVLRSPGMTVRGTDAWTREMALMQDVGAIAKAVRGRAEAAGHPQSDALSSASAVSIEAGRLWEQDLTKYAEAYLTTARRYLTERGISRGVELVAPQEWQESDWCELSDQIHEYARANAPMPMTGEAPDHSDGTPANALRRAGLSYLDRVRLATIRPLPLD
ncbi:hypothetical protein [Microbacterium arborescens]|uniref:hypothetical protein n=1 Tax=Microbacterium arborescens TaxID=33883 RepID=UPI003C73A52F